MYISRLVIQNFRNFEILDAKINNGVTTVIGDNNVGKSNLLHAVRLACDLNLPNYHRQLNELDFHCNVDHTVPQQIIISVEFKDFTSNENEDALCANWHCVDDETARLTYRFLPKLSVRTAIEQGNHPGTGLSIDDYEWEWLGGGETDPSVSNWEDPMGTGIKTHELQAFQTVYLNALRDVVSELRQTRTSPLTKLLRLIECSAEEKDKLVAVLSQANSEISKHELLKSLSSLIEKAYNNDAGEAHKLNIDVGLASANLESIERSLTLLLGNDFVEFLEPSRNGLGLNNILYISMLLEVFTLKEKAAKTAGQLLLLEEPEAHLHPQLQRVLYESLSARGVQTFITTHSSHLASHAKLNSFLILTNTGEAAISCSAIEERAELNREEIADLERYLDATRSTLLFARKVILVEGPAELYLIPIIAKQIVGFDLDRMGVSVVSINGTHFESYSKLFGENGLKVLCAIITDGDSEKNNGSRRKIGHLENDFVKVFQCDETFEKELVIPGLMNAISHAVSDAGHPVISSRFAQACLKPYDSSSLQKSILGVASETGKARFAQILCRHASLMTDAPEYIKNAIQWICD